MAGGRAAVLRGAVGAEHTPFGLRPRHAFGFPVSNASLQQRHGFAFAFPHGLRPSPLATAATCLRVHPARFACFLTLNRRLGSLSLGRGHEGLAELKRYSHIDIVGLRI